MPGRASGPDLPPMKTSTASITWSSTLMFLPNNPMSAAAWLPQPAAWKDYTVEAQTGDKHSMLELYRSALRIRRAHPALGEGKLRWLDAPSGVLL